MNSDVSSDIVFVEYIDLGFHQSRQSFFIAFKGDEYERLSFKAKFIQFGLTVYL